ncbi:MAG: HupE/UreJ family protein [Gammaproteobacteria bacterium]|jgi:hydrogenase/urease accessory protein HupE
MKTLSGSALTAAGLLVLPGTAHAHLVNSGLGPFYDGALHLLISPDDLLVILALALLAALRGPRAGRLTVLSLPAAWLLGGLAGLAMFPAAAPGWLGVVSFLVVGILVAADARLSAAAIAALAAACGAVHGLLNGAALAAVDAGIPGLMGIVLTALVLTLLVAGAAVPLRAMRARIALRVAGSWIGAVGLLMLGWLFQGAA